MALCIRLSSKCMKKDITTLGSLNSIISTRCQKTRKKYWRDSKKIIVCELNSGQFAKVLKINFSTFEFLQHNKVQGLPFANSELIQKFKQLL